ncbi:MAG: DsbA family protein [Acidimicrobiales bacterium]|jgi:hypothetical protein
MPLLSLSVTYDYRCPFARNAHDHLVTALRAGADWDVNFVPFSLSQVHVEPGETPVWDDPEHAGDLLAMEAGIAVRDRQPEHFLDVHQALFSARHDQGRDLRDAAVVASIVERSGADPALVMSDIDEGWPRRAFREAHEDAVARYQVFGVPTFIAGGRAMFARLMTRPDGDADLARSTIEMVVGMVAGHPELNELKATTIDR